jgi:anti-sigma factor RsiW
MNLEQQLKLQAYLDGELSEREARKIAELVAANDEARLLLTELRHTKNALAGNELEIKLPETREFYWSQIQRQIGRETGSPVASRPSPFAARFLRIFTPVAGAVALVALTVLTQGPGKPAFGTAESESSEAMTAFTLRSHSEPMTIVWLADKESSELAPGEAADKVDIQ